ncbi:unnamed protein product [Strongylus vulgaris]|uniref:Uncharacterized protein n=1 Tax=Strongylus vulgaris TaxID=40348 RepID=A0A3P7J467_STRVU|nr:unnamed protein product [Strongylus vulgaris]
MSREGVIDEDELSVRIRLAWLQWSLTGVLYDKRMPCIAVHGCTVICSTVSYGGKYWPSIRKEEKVHGDKDAAMDLSS